jgi:hypothetical protein
MLQSGSKRKEKKTVSLTQCIYVFLTVLREKLIISSNSVNLLVFVTEMKCVYFEVGAAFLNMICMNVGRRSGYDMCDRGIYRHEHVYSNVYSGSVGSLYDLQDFRTEEETASSKLM